MEPFEQEERKNDISVDPGHTPACANTFVCFYVLKKNWRESTVKFFKFLTLILSLILT